MHAAGRACAATLRARDHGGDLERAGEVLLRSVRIAAGQTTPAQPLQRGGLQGKRPSDASRAM
jgi:hypothetical protein